MEPLKIFSQSTLLFPTDYTLCLQMYSAHMNKKCI